MKNVLLIIFLSLFSSSILAQEITALQRQRALDKATRFCELLSQYSSGGENYLENDGKIFELCTSEKISTYDDIEGNKEDILVTYLFNILGNYHNKLQMTFSKPEIEEVFGIPVFDFYTTTNPLQDEREVVEFNDVYIIVKTQQTMPSISKSTSRKIIYSLNEDKIIAFTNADSPFINLQKAFIAFASCNYNSVFNSVDKVLAVKRIDYAMKHDAYVIAMVSAFFKNDIDNIKKYGSHLEKGFYNGSVGSWYLANGNISEGINYLEKADYETNEHFLFSLGGAYAMPSSKHDITKSKYYFEKGIIAKDPDVVRQSAYYYAVLALNDSSFGVGKDRILTLLAKAAELEFQPAYLPLSILYEEKQDFEESAVWSYSAAMCGSNIGKAMVGKYFLENFTDEKRRKIGLDCLKEAASSDIVAELNVLVSNCGLLPKFPRDKTDLLKVLSKYK